jgi:ATP-binding cassette subfamily B (MDR/TAP) protein 1
MARRVSNVNPHDHKEGGELEAVLDQIEDEDPEVKLAKQKMKEAEELDQKHDEMVKTALADINDAKKQGDLFKKKINEYNKPVIYSALGVLLSCMLGLVNPVFGAVLIKCVFSMLGLTAANHDHAIEIMHKWVVLLACFSAYVFVVATLRGMSFGYVAENVTENMRRDVYQSVLRKHMGWHDVRTNNSGVVTAVLAGECSSLQGLTGEAIGVIIECIASLGFAIAIGYYFAWPMATCALVLSPLMILGSLLQAGSDRGVKRDEDNKDESDVLASDAITNFRTVASFGCDEIITTKYHDLNEKGFQEEASKLQKHALSYGMS